MRATKQIIYDGVTVTKRKFATLAVVVRETSNEKYPPTIIDQQTNTIIMPKYDHSGYPHPLIVITDGKDKNYYRVLCSGTTSTSPYNGKAPEKISNNSLMGSNKLQMAHVYDEPRKIEKSSCKEIPKATELLENDPNYKKFCNKLKHEKNIHDDDKY